MAAWAPGKPRLNRRHILIDALKFWSMVFSMVGVHVTCKNLLQDRGCPDKAPEYFRQLDIPLVYGRGSCPLADLD
jgi:chloramphenicol 3-O-phosphotransferase